VSQADSNSVGRISLEQLLALNDEMVALVRAGIPLDRGLTDLGREAPGKLGLVATLLADRLRSGESLAKILERDETTFPPVWRSVVLAGIRSGHLAAALENLSRTGRRAMEIRGSIAVSLIYPFIVVLIAYGFLLFTISYLVPVISRAYVDLTSGSDPLVSSIVRLNESIATWGIWVPLCLILMFVFWWLRTGREVRSFSGSGRGQPRRFLLARHRPSRIPSIAQALHDGRMATFADLLRLMNDHQVPMREAIVLAADASGDRSLSRSARHIAKRLERGEVIKGREDLPTSFPPLLAWSVLTGAGQAGLSRTLATSAEMYRQRAARAARWAAIYLPILLTVVLGGSAVILQASLVFWPFTRLLYQLGMTY
jgi:general secretion pathway protein F